MRRKIIKYLFFIFLLFGIGGGIAIISLTRTSSDLNSLITLHRVEILRQDLVINLQTVQKHLYTIGTTFGSELDVIVDNVQSLDRAVGKCLGCHHNPEITRRLTRLTKYVEKYKDALSAFITTTANPERVNRLQRAAVEIGDVLLNEANEMTFVANQSLQERTERALHDVKTIKNLLLASLFLTMLFGFVVAASLTREILTPVEELIKGARMISAGKLGYKVNYMDSTEFGELAATFNEMSRSLKEGYEKTLSYMEKLRVLYKTTLSLHIASEREDVIREMVEGIRGILRLEGIVTMLREDDGAFRPVPPFIGVDEDALRDVACEPGQVYRIYQESGRRAVHLRRDHPVLGRFFSLSCHGCNILLFWLRKKEELAGCLLLFKNEKAGDFTEEDIRLLSIMGNNFAVALENVELYQNLHEQMRRLKEAQEQLVQSAKLAAVGELAANVAHEINNPLTTILGYSELLSEEEDPENIKRDLAIIESESLRAREIVQQLLEFSRKRKLELKEVDVHDTIDGVLKLVSPNIKQSRVKVHRKYTDVPKVLVDENQIKQVFLNLINNAIQAMPEGGDLVIETETMGQYLMIAIADTGMGIPDDVSRRIFEPFFTTKQDKGTGLGLPISYRIVQEHGGRIEVKSRVDEGSTFRVFLPLRRDV